MFNFNNKDRKKVQRADDTAFDADCTLLGFFNLHLTWPVIKIVVSQNINRQTKMGKHLHHSLIFNKVAGLHQQKKGSGEVELLNF